MRTIRGKLFRAEHPVHARAKVQREKQERKRERQRQSEEGESRIRMAATVGCQPRCSRRVYMHTHAYSCATRRAFISRHEPPTRTFLFCPTLFLRTAPLSPHARPSCSLLPSYVEASAVLQGLPHWLVVVATLKTELSAVPPGNRQLLLRLPDSPSPSPPQLFETDWTIHVPVIVYGNICAIARDNDIRRTSLVYVKCSDG